MRIEIKELVGAIFLTIDEMTQRFKGKIEELGERVDTLEKEHAVRNYRDYLRDKPEEEPVDWDHYEENNAAERAAAEAQMEERLAELQGRKAPKKTAKKRTRSRKS